MSMLSFVLTLNLVYCCGCGGVVVVGKVFFDTRVFVVVVLLLYLSMVVTLNLSVLVDYYCMGILHNLKIEVVIDIT